MSDLVWTPERIRKLREMWANPANTLAKIGVALGVSRNAVAGQRLRLDLPPRLSPVPSVRRAMKQAAEQQKQIPAGSRGAGEAEAVTARAPAKNPEAPQARPLHEAAAAQQPAIPAAGPEGEVVASASPDTGDIIRQAAAETRSHVAALLPGGARYRACQWPEGEPGKPGFRFCGAPSVRHSPYCLEHRARAFTTRKDPAA